MCGVFIPLTKRFYFRNDTYLAIQFAGLFSTPTLYVSGIITVIVAAKIIKVEENVCGVFIPLTEVLFQEQLHIPSYSIAGRFMRLVYKLVFSRIATVQL